MFRHLCLALSLSVILAACAITSEPTLNITAISGSVTETEIYFAAPTASVSIPITSIPITPTPSKSIPTKSPAPTITPEPVVTPPDGIVFRTSEGVWVMKVKGKKELIVEIPSEVDSIQFCSTGKSILLGTYLLNGGVTFSAIEVSTKKQVELNPGANHLFCYAYWWPGQCDTVLALVQPWLEVGRYCLSIPALLDLSNNLSFIGKKESIFGGLSSPSSDGRILAFSEDGKPWLFRWGIGSRQLVVESNIFPLVNAGFYRPTWSPDNSQVAWLVSGEMEGARIEGIGIFDLENNRSLFFYPYEAWSGEFPSYLYWNPQGTYILLETPNHQISVLNLDGTVKYSMEIALGPKWSPDGKWLSYSLSNKGVFTVFVRSTEGEESHKLGIGESVVWSPDSRYLLYENPDGFLLTEVGIWNPRRINLPEDAVIVDWVGSE